MLGCCGACCVRERERQAQQDVSAEADDSDQESRAYRMRVDQTRYQELALSEPDDSALVDGRAPSSKHAGDLIGCDRGLDPLNAARDDRVRVGSAFVTLAHRMKRRAPTRPRRRR
jgi:hypothetical protein